MAGEEELGQADRLGQRGMWNRGGLIYRQSGEWSPSRRLVGEREPGQRRAFSFFQNIAEKSAIN